MPEQWQFIYHKMMEEYILSEGYTQTCSLYAGYFVDNVVAPVCDVVIKVWIDRERGEECATSFPFEYFVQTILTHSVISL